MLCNSMLLTISIHAPRVGSDMDANIGKSSWNISIHAPRVGSDVIFIHVSPSKAEFQSTLPVWGATKYPLKYSYAYLFQSTLPVWGATLISKDCNTSSGYFNPRSPHISIHAPRVGSDSFLTIAFGFRFYFNPRSPCGERHFPAEFLSCC